MAVAEVGAALGDPVLLLLGKRPVAGDEVCSGAQADQGGCADADGEGQFGILAAAVEQAERGEARRQVTGKVGAVDKAGKAVAAGQVVAVIAGQAPVHGCSPWFECLNGECPEGRGGSRVWLTPNAVVLSRLIMQVLCR